MQRRRRAGHRSLCFARLACSPVQPPARLACRASGRRSRGEAGHSPSPDLSFGAPDLSSGHHTPCASDSRSARWARHPTFSELCSQHVRGLLCRSFAPGRSRGPPRPPQRPADRNCGGMHPDWERLSLSGYFEALEAHDESAGEDGSGERSGGDLSGCGGLWRRIGVTAPPHYRCA